MNQARRQRRSGGHDGAWRLVATVVISLVLVSPAGAQTHVTVHSLAELRQYADADDHVVTLAAGEYWLEGDGDDPTFLALTGANTTYDFTAAAIKVDTRRLDGYGGGHANTVNLVGLYGQNVTIQGLSLEGVHVGDLDDGAQRWADAVTNFVRIAGTDNTLRDSHLVVRGSSPYGFGDAFGKGGRPSNANQPGGVPFISHHKGLGVQVQHAVGATIDGLDLDMHAFGHGIYIQNGDDTTVRNTTITGELFSSNDVINAPLYQQYGVNTYGVPMFPDILISGSEDGVRVYGEDTGGLSENLTVENVVVRNMREAFSTFAAGGTVTIHNSEAYGNETGFEPGSNTTITGSRGDATNGPLLYFRRPGITNADVELELVGDVPQVGRDWDIAYISGTGNDVTLTSSIDPALLSEQAMVRIAQRFNDWRHAQSTNIDNGHPASNLSLINTTGQTMVIGPNAMQGSSNYGVTSGNVLGGDGTIVTRAQGSGVDIVFQAGGKLDPRGALTLDVGEGEVELHPAVDAEVSEALLFFLDTLDQSDRVHVAGRLDIGFESLGLDDFNFTLGDGFGHGTYVLFDSDRAIQGSLGEDFAGVLGGRHVTLAMSDDRRSLNLIVTPEPGAAGAVVLLALIARRRTR